MSDSDVLNRAAFAQKRADSQRDARFQKEITENLKKQIALAEAEAKSAKKAARFAKVMAIISATISLGSLAASIIALFR